jgi:hypothetical protein
VPANKPYAISPAHGDAVGVLARILVDCLQTMPVDAGAIAVMTPGGHRGTAYATDAAVSDIEELQFTIGEGPGVDAFLQRRAVLVNDLADHRDSETAWSGYGSAALELDYRAVFAFPLRIGSIGLGTLTLYAHEPVELSAEDVARVTRFADAAAICLLDLVAKDGDPPSIATGMPTAIVGANAPSDEPYFRSVVHQASGMIMIQLGIEIAEALSRLRAYAFAEGRSVTDVAREVVARKLRFSPSDV